MLTTFADLVANALACLQARTDLEAAHRELVTTLTRVVCARDPYTGGHSESIADLAAAVAQELGLSPAEVQNLRVAALLHDIGKVAIPDGILHKPGPLEPEEWAVVRKHPDIGARILASARHLWPVIPIVRHHHERWDGRGYPDGLSGEAIPLGARILAVVDAYAAMTDVRPYRTPLPVDLALQELRRCAGTQFDPQIVDAFLRTLERRGTR
jgi:putative nucleotidyltransferase with HDIG domain